MNMRDYEKQKHCCGCHDDFYNQQGHSAEGKCWMFKSAKLIWRKSVDINQRPPWNQKAERFLSCYHRQGAIFVKPDQTN